MCYPEVGDRSSPKEWIEQGKPDLVEKALAEKRRILATVFPDHIPEPVDAAIRARFDIVAAARKHARPRLEDHAIGLTQRFQTCSTAFR